MSLRIVAGCIVMMAIGNVVAEFIKHYFHLFGY